MVETIAGTSLSIDGGGISIDSMSITIDAGVLGIFSAEQYGEAAKALLPPGRAWSRDDGMSVADYCDALGIIYAQQDSDCVQMLGNFFPSTATQGLDEWNASLGLPDECMGAPASQAANQQQITARLTATGGQDIPYYTQIALALGFQISITEFSPTKPGGDPPAGMITKAADWAHTWRVNILNSGSAPATSLLQCLLERYKPAHTQFYIVSGTSPTSSTRLFDVADNDAEPLTITITVR